MDNKLAKNGSKWRSEAHAFVRATKVPLIVIVGPTASGKTSFSIELALDLQKEGFTPEIINADSRQLYKLLDIGTAKITEDEKRGVMHHLLSVLDPKEEVSIAWFQREATAVIKKLHSERKIPILVGGSMLYVSSIIDGLEPLPSDASIRERLTKEYEVDSGETLHTRLSELDPDAAQSIPRQNKIYLIRALELLEMTGKSALDRKKISRSPYDLLMFGMCPELEELKKRIGLRIKAMFDVGWIDEVRSLLAKGYLPTDPGMKSVGYAEIAALLEGKMKEADAMSAIAKKTRAYAKRSRTWWRDDSRILWLTQSTAS